MNVLIIPSWFGDSESPNAGTFFKDEATLVSSCNCVVMMIFERISTVVFSSGDNVRAREGMTQERISDRFTIVRARLLFNDNMSWEDNIRSFKPIVLKFFEAVYHEFKMDIIHAYATFWAGIFARWISHTYCIPYMITEHFGPFNLDFLHSDYIKGEMRSAINESDSFACVSQHLRQQILMNGILRDSFVIGNYVNDGLFQINENLSEENLLLTVAYYPSYIKDINTLLYAYSKLVIHGVEFKAIIVGGGEKKGGYDGENSITRLVNEFNLSNFVQVIDAVRHDEMVKLMQRCSFYVCSSIAESFGVSICEAMLCGKPCVITANGGSMDFADDSNSIVVDIHNPDELAKGVIRLMECRNMFNPNEIRNKIVKKYGAKTFIHRINEVYCQIRNARY